MTDADALALNCFQEANLEPLDGIAAIARVVLNRAALKYQSDGTIQGTIFHPAAFSWTQYAMVGGHYTKVAVTNADVAIRAADLLRQAKAYTTAWARALDVSGQVMAGTYSGPLYDLLTPETVLYDNLALAQPVWATPDKHVCTIGHHDFYTN